VGLKEKVEEALRRHLQLDLVKLVDDEGISGFVVSEKFQGMRAIDRQTLIHKALRDPAVKFTKAERRRILGIAAATPVEYASVMSR
jgi:hypothetical protein